jgi:CheY-like chemotaxis protein
MGKVGKKRLTDEGSSEASGTDMRSSLTDEPPTDSSPPPVKEVGQKRLSIVIVEDNVDSRNMLCELLQFDGHHVTVAEDGPTGLQAIEVHQPDVALIDIGLPGMSGYEVAENVRNGLRDESVRLIALTGHARAEDRRAVREAGFDEHLAKPLRWDDLARALAKADSGLSGNSVAD